MAEEPTGGGARGDKAALLHEAWWWRPIDRDKLLCYLGNVHDSEAQATVCPSCHEALIRRGWHAVQHCALIGNRCPRCNEVIPGVFHAGPHCGEERGTSGGRYRVRLT